MSTYLGIDAGSTYIKAAWISDNGEITRLEAIPTHADFEKAIARFLESQHENAIATGYCRKRISEIFGIENISEIKAHARGAHLLFPEARTIIDIGGQDSKVIRINDRGKVIDFIMNDRCAAGTGRFLEIAAARLGVSVNDLSPLAENSSTNITISSMCVVFAESEIISLLAQGTPKESIAKAVIDSVATRVSSMAKGFGLQEPVAFTGGCALCTYLVEKIAEILGVRITTSDKAQFAGAIGAAVEAMRSTNKASGLTYCSTRRIEDPR